MTDKKKTQDANSPSPDLSVLTDFQFGPSWARQDSKKEYSSRSFSDSKERSGKEGRRGGGKFSGKGRQSRDFGDRKEGFRTGGDRDNRDNRRSGGFGDNRRFGDKRNDRFSKGRERAPLPEPTQGLRVELRPVDHGLAACAAEVTKHKRVVSLFDFAKIIIAKRDRYDLVFMKQEDGPRMIASQKGDHACWLERNEALSYLWKAPWFSDFYDALEEDAEAPKGVFTAIGKCVLTGELIGPVNWHGYQSALVNLHRVKFSHMDFDHFKSKIQVEKGEEIVQEWLDSVSKKTVWKPKRSGEEEVLLKDTSEVEQDFSEHHFDEVYVETDKVFINGSVTRGLVSPGLWAHIVQLSDVTRKHPSMLIPNLCHGLARHHMPIFKWKGGHHTGPSRPKALSEETVLADRMRSIINWVEEHPGRRVDMMLKELCGDLPEADSKEEAPVQEQPAIQEEAVVTETEVVETEPQPAQEETESVATPQDESPEVNEAAPEASEEVKALSGEEQKRQQLVMDLFWLCDQGYVLVFADGKINLPRIGNKPQTEQAPKADAPKAKKAKKPAKPKKKKEKPVEAKESPVAESAQPDGEQKEEPVDNKVERAKEEPVSVDNEPLEDTKVQEATEEVASNEAEQN